MGAAFLELGPAPKEEGYTVSGNWASEVLARRECLPAPVGTRSLLPEDMKPMTETQVCADECRLVAFYSGASPDDRGRRLADIQAWGFDELEHTHDYIQWLFPLRKRSPFNPSAPVLDAEAVAAFRSRQDLRDAFVRSLATMLHFYGFKLDGPGDEPEVRCSEQFEARVTNWMTAGNHNHLRITRILACTRTIGFSRHAVAFFRALQEVYWSEAQARSHGISEESFSFWKSAAGLGKPDR